MTKGAIFDVTKQYRYSLWRIWDESKPKITYIMLNGSTADAENDDPTLRRCIGYAKAWGYGSLEIVNLFGYWTPLPSELKKSYDPVGPENDIYITKSVKDAEKVLVAWGSHGKFKRQNKHVLDLLEELCIEPFCLGVSKDGNPKHPLYLKADLQPVRYCGLLI